MIQVVTKERKFTFYWYIRQKYSPRSREWLGRRLRLSRISQRSRTPYENWRADSHSFFSELLQYHMISFIDGIYKTKQMNKQSRHRPLNTENKLRAARGEGVEVKRSGRYKLPLWNELMTENERPSPGNVVNGPVIVLRGDRWELQVWGVQRNV